MRYRVSLASSVAIGLLSVSAVGCSKDSSDLSTHDIHGSFFVKVDPMPAPGTTQVTVVLHNVDASGAVGSDYVKLSNGDGLTVTTDKNDDLPLGMTSDGTYETKLTNAD